MRWWFAIAVLTYVSYFQNVTSNSWLSMIKTNTIVPYHYPNLPYVNIRMCLLAVGVITDKNHYQIFHRITMKGNYEMLRYFLHLLAKMEKRCFVWYIFLSVWFIWFLAKLAYCTCGKNSFTCFKWSSHKVKSTVTDRLMLRTNLFTCN